MPRNRDLAYVLLAKLFVCRWYFQTAFHNTPASHILAKQKRVEWYNHQAKWWRVLCRIQINIEIVTINLEFTHYLIIGVISCNRAVIFSGKYYYIEKSLWQTPYHRITITWSVVRIWKYLYLILYILIFIYIIIYINIKCNTLAYLQCEQAQWYGDTVIRREEAEKYFSFS